MLMFRVGFLQLSDSGVKVTEHINGISQHVWLWHAYGEETYGSVAVTMTYDHTYL